MEQLETERWSVEMRDERWIAGYRRRDGAVRDGEMEQFRDGEIEQLEMRDGRDEQYRRRDGAVRDGEMERWSSYRRRDGAVRDGEMDQLETERWSS